MARLVPQLSPSADPLTAYELEGIIESPATTLFVARDSGHDIVGALTLVVFRAPTGVRGWIEDVVVDESVRGAGIGSALVEAAITEAREPRLARSISRPVPIARTPTACTSGSGSSAVRPTSTG